MQGMFNLEINDIKTKLLEDSNHQGLYEIYVYDVIIYLNRKNYINA